VKGKVHSVTGPIPVPALTCPDTPELAGARSLRRFRRSAASVLRRLLARRNAVSHRSGYCDAAFRDAAHRDAAHRDAAHRCNMQA